MPVSWVAEKHRFGKFLQASSMLLLVESTEIKAASPEAVAITNTTEIRATIGQLIYALHISDFLSLQ